MREIVQFDLGASSIQDIRIHQEPEIIYVLKGTVAITIDQDKYHLNEGDFLLINANKPHSVVNTVKDVLCARFMFDYPMMMEYMKTDQLLFWCNTVVDKDEAYKPLRKIMDQILNMYFEEMSEEKFHLHSLYYEMIYLLVSNFMVKISDNRIKNSENEEDVRIFEVKNYIQANYYKQISLNDLADKLHLSYAYLSKYIRKHLGLSFTEYLNNIRLYHALDELIHTDKKIISIAVDSGFPTSTAFNKSFKELYKKTPSEYRLEVAKKENKSSFHETMEKDKRNHRRVEAAVGWCTKYWGSRTCA